MFVALDQTAVVNVMGYLPSAGQLFGIDMNQRAYVVSEDLGATWMSLTQKRFAYSCVQNGFIGNYSAAWQTTVTSASGVAPWSGRQANVECTVNLVIVNTQ